MAEELESVKIEKLSQTTAKSEYLIEPDVIGLLFEQLTIGSDSQTYVAYELLFTFIHRISSLVFVGKQFCYNTIWTDAVTALPVDVEITKFILLPFPDSLRRIIAPLIPQRNRIFSHRTAVKDLIFAQSAPHSIEDELSVLKLLIQSGKDTDPDSVTARLLLLTAAAVSGTRAIESRPLLTILVCSCTRPPWLSHMQYSICAPCRNMSTS